MLFSIVAVPTYIPIYGAQSFPFLHILTNASYFFFYDEDHSDRCKVVSNYGFDLHFPKD